MNPMRSLERIRTSLAAHRCREAPVQLGSTFEAAVALILHEPRPSQPELLFIERAQRAGDPWSGHMAFPGGRRDPGDSDLLATALRETLEEVGFTPSEPLGRLDDFSGSRRPKAEDLVVGAYVFSVLERPQILASAEVQSTVWVPLAAMHDPASWTEHAVEGPTGSRRLPALRYDGYVIWGLTLRILSSFFASLGEPLPALAAAEAQPAELRPERVLAR